MSKMMRHRTFGLLSLLALLSWSSPQAQGKQTTTIRVTETSGLRRTEYPVRARVSVPQRTVADATHVQLRLNDTPVPAQYTVMSKWPDGSAQAIDVDFNASLAPAEVRAYQLDFGPEVTAGAPPRGLAVTEEADAVQIGNVKFSKSAAPLMASAAYVRSEFIGQFPGARNGFAIVDKAGARHELSIAPSLKAELLKRGPLSVVLQYSGSVPIDAKYSVPVTLTVEMPNSKSWVKMSASVNDSGRRVRDLEFDAPLALGAFPWVWDFGTENGTYGAFRTANDAAVLTQILAPGPQETSAWRVDTGTQAELRPYEASVRSATPAAGDRGRLASGWGHLVGPATAVAFAIDGLGDLPGTYTVTLGGQGQVTYRFSPSGNATTHRFGVYQHFVSTPVAIGAATTPTSMLKPPVVVVAP
jgi:hypothetical protein